MREGTGGSGQRLYGSRQRTGASGQGSHGPSQGSHGPGEETGEFGQRLYGPQDMVRISSSACAGCGACCRGMGDTIVLDPYDVWQLTSGLGKSFEELMGAGIDLHVEEGVILPHLMMRSDTQSCAFLGPDGRCMVHSHRPGICRLFPLGRQFDEEKTSYFIVPEGCVKGGLSKVRIDKWLGIPDLPAYESFKAQWHSLVRLLKARIAAEPSEEVRRNVNLYFVRVFFMAPYEGAASADAFYREAADRSQKFAGAVL